MKVTWAGRVLGVLALLALCWVPSPLQHVEGFGARPAYAAGVAALMALWWLFEALPMGAVACLPILLFPLLGVTGKGAVEDLLLAVLPFTDAYILLFLGGMTLGAAMEQTGLHKRIALHIMLLIGTRAPLLLLGMLCATAFMSMWISNTATAVMMLPIGVALIRQLEEQVGTRLNHFGGAVMLAVAYGANIGGVGTKIGTGTNSIFCGFAARMLGRDLGFVEFMLAALPFVLLFIPVTWRVLWHEARRDVVPASGGEVLRTALRAMGVMSGAECRVLATFCLAAFCWILGDVFRPLVTPWVPVLWKGFSYVGKHYEATVAMLAAGAVILMRCVSWRMLRALPWETLLLLGGSFAMAGGLEQSGFASWMAGELQALTALPWWLQVGLATSATILLSAIASNTATINLMLNVLPRSLPLLFAATLAASCDFALPAGTPPNAIVFGSGYVRLPVMMRVGFVLDVLAAVIITLLALFYVPLVL